MTNQLCVCGLPLSPEPRGIPWRHGAPHPPCSFVASSCQAKGLTVFPRGGGFCELISLLIRKEGRPALRFLVILSRKKKIGGVCSPLLGLKFSEERAGPASDS